MPTKMDSPCAIKFNAHGTWWMFNKYSIPSIRDLISYSLLSPDSSYELFKKGVYRKIMKVETQLYATCTKSTT